MISKDLTRRNFLKYAVAAPLCVPFLANDKKESKVGPMEVVKIWPPNCNVVQKVIEEISKEDGAILDEIRSEKINHDDGSCDYWLDFTFIRKNPAADKHNKWICMCQHELARAKLSLYSFNKDGESGGIGIFDNLYGARKLSYEFGDNGIHVRKYSYYEDGLEIESVNFRN